jgi:hypothetical protein
MEEYNIAIELLQHDETSLYVDVKVARGLLLVVCADTAIATGDA